MELNLFSHGIAPKKEKYGLKFKRGRVFKGKFPTRISPPIVAYTGPRYWIPAHICESESVYRKFMSAAAGGIKEMSSRIKKASWSSTFNIIIPDNAPKIISDEVRDYLADKLNEQIKDWVKVARLYKRVSNAFPVIKKFIWFWRGYRCKKNVKNTVDAVSLEVPKSPLYILDYKLCISHVYEARTIKRLIELRIFQSDYMFPEPQPPFNPLTNQDLTLAQLIAVNEQLRSYGIFSWIIDRLVSHGGRVTAFANTFRTLLKLAAIDAHFHKDSKDAHETITDHFERKADEYIMDDEKIEYFCNRIKKNPNDPMVKQWTNVTKDLYIAIETNDQLLLKKCALITDILIKKVDAIELD